MATDFTGELPPPDTEIVPIASFWRRLAAFALDCVFLSVPALFLGMLLFKWATDLGEAGRLLGFVVVMLYFGLLNSRIGRGQTLGKRMMGLWVIDRYGGMLSPKRAMIRTLFLTVPYFLYGAWFDMDAISMGLFEYIFVLLMTFVVLGGLGSIVYLYVFNRQTRQSLHDLAVDSFVVSGRPDTLPIRRTTPRLHIVIMRAWLAVAFFVPGAGLLLEQSAYQSDQRHAMTEVTDAIQERLGLSQVQVTLGLTNMALLDNGDKSTSYVLLTARTTDQKVNLDDLVITVGGVVLEYMPNLLGKQALAVQVDRGFNFGIASWDETAIKIHDATAWQEALRKKK